MTSSSEETKTKLKKAFYLLLAIAILGLLIAAFLLGRAVYQTQQGIDSSIFPIVAIVAVTMGVIPAAMAAIVGSKLKRKK